MKHISLLSLITVLGVTLPGLAACAPGRIPAPPPAAAPAAAPATAPAAVHWTYEGEEGPTHWGSLSPAYEACSVSKTQSPVDISKPVEKDLANIVFHYQPGKINIIDNGHTIQLNYDPGSYIELDGTRYDLIQFHFHDPSEHSVDGKLASAEMHLVHKSADGKTAVVGVLINAGAENLAFKSAWDNLPDAPGPVQQINAEVNAAAMLPAVQNTYRYDGSLTTPPCTDGVKWAVMVKPIEMSEAQLAKLAHLIKGNNRPVQSLDGRTVVVDTTP